MIGKVLKVIPVSSRLLLIIWPFLGIVVILVWLFIESMSILIATRSYAEGESLWSKAQKQSVFQLLRYAQTRDPAYYDNYRRLIRVNLGDRRAREEMQRSRFDYGVAFEGLTEGRTHPDDIPHVVRLFRRFQHVPPITEVIKTWTDGDQLIDQMQAAAEQLHAAVSGNAPDAALRPIADRILEIDGLLTPLEDRFTRKLGDAARLAQWVLLLVILTAAGLLVPIGIYLSQRMLSHSQRFERALKVSEERFQVAVTGSNDGLWDWNIAADHWYYSPRFKELLGYADHEMESSLAALTGRLHAEDAVAFHTALEAHLQRAVPFDVEIRLLTRSEGYRWFRVRGRSVRNAADQPVRIAGALTDITDKQLAAAELFAEKERAQVTLASIGDGVVTTDIEGWVEYLNPVAEDLTGWKLSDAKGLPIQALFRLVDEASRRPAPSPIELVLNEERTIEAAANILLQRNDGVEIPVGHSAAPIRDRTGRVIGVVLVLHDMSRERQYAAKLSYQASHDALTGLINRMEFEKRLGLALHSAAQMGRHHAVLYLDLDQFKVVNDTCGHAAGDQLMRQVATLLGHCLREGDTLARLGGDEFGVLLENCPPDAAERIADKLRQTVTDFHFVWAHRRFTIGVSIGLVNVEDGLFNLTEVLSAADTACYMAKDKGRNRVQVYHRGDNELTQRQGEMEWVEKLHQALEENRFVLYAQDIVQISESAEPGTHCEILVRMRDERGNLILPGAFIPAAERYNLMPSIDRWVIRNALSTLARMRADPAGERIDLCTINVSGDSFADEHFLDFVREQLSRFSVAHQCICFEITETAAIRELDKAAHFIKELRAMGCRFSLDDFGAGMSSFAYLKHLPVDFLKIDGVFVKDMADDPIDRAMVEAINNVGHVMGKQTIAEWVESDRLITALRDIGVDFAQGFGVAKPRPFAPRLQIATRVA